jgi:hypothetical protein
MYYNVTFSVFAQPLLQWKTIIITHSECVFVALSKQYAMRMRHIVICGLSGSTIPLNVSKNVGLSGKKSY